MSDIGDKIREAREKIGMTQDELWYLMGYKGKAAISKIETGVVGVSQEFWRCLREWRDTVVFAVSNEISWFFFRSRLTTFTHVSPPYCSQSAVKEIPRREESPGVKEGNE